MRSDIAFPQKQDLVWVEISDLYEREYFDNFQNIYFCDHVCSILPVVLNFFKRPKL